MKKLLIMLVLLATSAQAEIYAWKDSRGTTHYTNSTVEIPARYRAKAKVLNLGPELKDQTSGQQPIPSPAQPAVPAPATGTEPQQQTVSPAPPTVTVPQPRTREERRRARQSRPARIVDEE